MVGVGLAIDIDHTLLRTEQFQYEAWKKTLGHTERFTEKLYCNTYCGRGSWEIAQEIVVILSRDPKELYEERMRKLDNILSKQKSFVLCAGAEMFFDYIHQEKLPYVLVTGGSKQESNEKIAKSDLKNIIKKDNPIITKDDYTCSKPNPEPYLMAKEVLKKLHGGDYIKKYIGFEDTVAGMLSAVSAGYDNVHIIPHERTKISFDSYQKMQQLPKNVVKLNRIDDYRL